MIKKIKPFLQMDSVASGSAVLMLGSVGAQLATILASPVLTRFYSPEDFGILSLFTSLLVVISATSSMRYEYAIPLPKEDDDARSLVVLSFIILLGFTSLTALAVFIFRDPIVTQLENEKIGPYLFLLPVGVVLLGIYQILNFWNLRMKNFSAIARTRFLQSSVSILIQLCGIKLGVLSLILGQIAGQGAGGSYLYKKANFNLTPSRFSIANLKLVARRYKKFPMFSLWGGLMNTLGGQVIPILFASLYNPYVIGHYALAYRVIATPSSILGDALGSVFFSNASEALREGRLKELVFDTFTTLCKFAVPVLFLFFFVAPDIFAIIFSEKWRESGVYAQLLVPMILFQFLNSPIGNVFTVKELQFQGLILQIILVAMRVCGIFIGAHWGVATESILIYSIFSSFCYILFLILNIRASGNSFWIIPSTLIKEVLISSVFVIPVVVNKFMFQNRYFFLCLGISLFLVLIRCGFVLKTTNKGNL